MRPGRATFAVVAAAGAVSLAAAAVFAVVRLGCRKRELAALRTNALLRGWRVRLRAPPGPRIDAVAADHGHGLQRFEPGRVRAQSGRRSRRARDLGDRSRLPLDGAGRGCCGPRVHRVVPSWPHRTRAREVDTSGLHRGSDLAPRAAHAVATVPDVQPVHVPRLPCAGESAVRFSALPGGCDRERRLRRVPGVLVRRNRGHACAPLPARPGRAAAADPVASARRRLRRHGGYCLDIAAAPGIRAGLDRCCSIYRPRRCRKRWHDRLHPHWAAAGRAARYQPHPRQVAGVRDALDGDRPWLRGHGRGAGAGGQPAATRGRRSPADHRGGDAVPARSQIVGAAGRALGVRSAGEPVRRPYPFRRGVRGGGGPGRPAATSGRDGTPRTRPALGPGSSRSVR